MVSDSLDEGVEHGVECIGRADLGATEAQALEDGLELAVGQHVQLRHCLLDQGCVETFSHGLYRRVLGPRRGDVVRDVLPDGMREVVHGHLKFDYSVGLLVGVPLSQELDETDIERVGALLGDGV